VGGVTERFDVLPEEHAASRTATATANGAHRRTSFTATFSAAQQAIAMPHPLDSVGLKCERARHNLDTLEREFNTFERDAFRYRHAVEREGREHAYRVTAVRKTRPEWGPIIGDCLRNAALALDHLAHQLAVLNTGALSDDLARNTHFPIYETPEEFWDNLPKLRAIGPDQVAPLERLQPYNGRYGPDYDPLMILERLSNFDKHRTIQTIGYRFGGTADYYPDSLIDTVFPEGPIKLGAELARFTFHPPAPEMDVGPNFIVHIAFQGTPVADGVGVWAMLNTICTRVETIADDFRPLFS
jgi:hypothetical protein